ncbi:MAG: VWA domain-containing protein [Nitrospiraceae bacterium]
MAFSESSWRDRLTQYLAVCLDGALIATLEAEIERLGLASAATALLQELEDASPKVARAATEALPELHRRVGLDDLGLWLDLAVGMAESSGASGLKYVKESPLLLGLVPSREERVRILTMALELAERDPGMTLEFLRVSPELVGLLSPASLMKWIDQGLELSDVNYVLGGEFFRESPKIVKAIALDDLRSWTSLALKLITVNQFGKPDYMATLEFFRTTPALLEDLPEATTRRLIIRIAGTLAEQDPQLALEVLAEAPALMQPIPAGWQSRMLQYGLLVAERDASVAQAYLRRCSGMAGLVGTDDRAWQVFEAWFKSGMEVLAYSVEGARAYFALETSKALASLEEAQSGVPLRQVARSLTLFAQALCGRNVRVEALPDDTAGTSGSGQAAMPRARATVSADGRTIYLPSVMRRESDREANRRAYLVMVAHEAGHLEFGTYDLAMAELGDLAETVAARYGRSAQEAKSTPRTLVDFFALYPQPGVIRDLWTILEDARIEGRLRVEYPGLRADLDAATKAALSLRSLTHGMSMREMVLDAILLASSGISDVSIPDAIRQVVADCWGLGRAVLAEQVTAGDVIRIIDQVYVRMDELLRTAAATSEEAPDHRPQESSVAPMVGGRQASETLTDAYQPIDNWSYRGGMRPEFIGADEQRAEAGGGDQSDRGKRESNGKEVASSSQRTTGRQARDLTRTDGGLADTHAAPDHSADEVTAIADKRQPRWEQGAIDAGTYHYDEWDGTIRDYRSRWCCVREQRQASEDADFVETVLSEHGAAIRVLRRYFEGIRPPAFRQIRGQTYGDDVDLDAAVSVRADLAAGTDPTDRLYIRRDRQDRSVAVAFLVDLSGSTGRTIAEDGRRVIDVEKAGLVLLCEALEAIGDEYALYGFSGRGRQDVDFVVLKDFDERSRSRVASRIGAVQPMHQNRDGAAIRHAAAKLKLTEARVQLLVLLSDGRPLDDHYAEEYALEDTKMALREAAAKGIVPFCITVDREAESYLRRMYGEVRYVVIDDVQGLPERLPRVYHRLTS